MMMMKEKELTNLLILLDQGISIIKYIYNIYIFSIIINSEKNIILAWNS